MGYTADHIRRLCVFTRKQPRSVVGCRIWGVTGEGAPRRFYLFEWFVADSISASQDPEFAWCVSGTKGALIPRSSWPRLETRPWFGPFLKAQGHFAFGLSPISDPMVVAALDALGLAPQGTPGR